MERRLQQDLATIGDELDDDSFAEELYRGLANTRWYPPEGGPDHVSLSWSKAEALVNALREARGQKVLTLAQTGGEGEISGRVAEALTLAGWSARPQDTSRHDDGHVESAPSGPSGEAGDGPEWERQAREEADRERARKR